MAYTTNTEDHDKFEESSGNITMRIVAVSSAGYSQSSQSTQDKEKKKFITNNGGDTAVRVISVSP